MAELEEIADYYDNLAEDYDESRFANSYGEFLHAQEQALMSSLLAHFPSGKVLSIGCGTGRFMEYADYGLDVSEAMLEIAQAKHPDKNFVHAQAADTNFPDMSFHVVFALHLFFHLDKEQVAEVLEEAYRILLPGGRLIFDVPSDRRRQLLGGHHNESWHGSNAYSLAELEKTFGEQWEILQHHGLLFLPIHRIYSRIRPYLLPLDNFLCRIFVSEYSSYMMVVMEKR